MNIKDVIGDHEIFFSDILASLEKISIDINQMPISHLCYRTIGLEEYETLREKLKTFCKEFVETLHNGRPVSIFELRDKLLLAKGFSFSFIELPAPKNKIDYPSGLEHVGFVAGNKLSEFKIKYKTVLTGEKDLRPFDSPAFVAFNNGKTAKFYQLSLKEIVLMQGWNFEAL